MPNNLNLLHNDAAADMDSDGLLDYLNSLAIKISYFICGGLVIGDIMNYLNEYAKAFGVILGFLTFMLQLYFGIKKQCAYVRSLGLKK